MLFVSGTINHNPKKITPEREAPVAVWAKHLNNSIKEDQKNILPVLIFDWYYFHIEGPQGVNPLKAPPQTSDLLALMDFAVWELDHSQPKTDFFSNKKNIYECPPPPGSPSTGLASMRTGRPIKTKNMMATHFLETITLLLMVEITLAAISRLGRGCIPAGWSSAFADLRIRRTDDLTARRTTKLLLARLREPGEGFTQPWHSVDFQSGLGPTWHLRFLEPMPYGTDGKAVTFSWNPS